jgi:hypothetical protein
MRLDIKGDSNNAFEQFFPHCIFLSSIFVNVRIDCSNVNRANDLAKLLCKEGGMYLVGSQHGFKIQMLTKERPVDEKILNEGTDPARHRRMFFVRTVSWLIFEGDTLA